MPGVEWAQIRQVAGVVRATLADFGLAGWPKTSGSRGMHVCVRIERRWTFDQVRRAALAFAREVERRAPQLATSKWWKEERHGVFLDYNQNAKDRTVASAYSVRPTPDARVSAPLEWDEVGACEPADFTLATMPARFARGGDRHAGIDDRADSLEALLELSERQQREGLGDAPWPPHYRKQAGEAPRVAPSEARRAPAPDATSGDRDFARAREGRCARRIRSVEDPSRGGGGPPSAGGCAGRRDAGTLPHVDARPRQPAARPRAAAPAQEALDPGEDMAAEWHGMSGAAE